MADSTSDSGSVQSLQTEQVVEKKTESTTRFYALYSFYPQRIPTIQRSEEIATETQDQDEGSLSLNIVATNLAATAETDLRKLLAQKFIKSARQTKEGNFFFIRLSSTTSDTLVQASCYYCQIEAPSEGQDFDPLLSESRVEETDDSQQFVVCFISFLDSSLYLFRQELEQYLQNLVPLLDKELSQLSTGIHGYLRQWPVYVLDFLTRTIQYMGSNVQHLIYSALLNASLQISGTSPQQEEDIRRFYKCCSLSPFLSPLLEQLQADNMATSDGTSNNDLWQLKPIVVTITFLPEHGVTFDKKYVCKFCESASDALTSMDVMNVSKIREVLEAIKLRFIRNMNTLKRFLKQAEIDHYALYRALSYLKKCGCGDLLLRYVKLDAGPDTLNVLTVLETFIGDMNLTLT